MMAKFSDPLPKAPIANAETTRKGIIAIRIERSPP
jgi:hypothetical protein